MKKLLSNTYFIFFIIFIIAIIITVITMICLERHCKSHDGIVVFNLNDGVTCIYNGANND